MAGLVGMSPARQLTLYPCNRSGSICFWKSARSGCRREGGALVGVGWSVEVREVGWRGWMAWPQVIPILTSGHLGVQVGFLLEVDRDEVVEALEAAVLSRSHERRLSTLHKGE